jgi:hypothetical protein
MIELRVGEFGIALFKPVTENQIQFFRSGGGAGLRDKEDGAEQEQDGEERFRHGSTLVNELQSVEVDGKKL